jgi:hypothetical protein
MVCVPRSNVLFHMMSFIQFPVILSKIIQQHGTYRFDEFKQVVNGALLMQRLLYPVVHMCCSRVY